jgi:tRNA-dihydrouridine synthase
MVGARGLVEGDRTSALKASFAPDEDPRSIQLYAIDPEDAAGRPSCWSTPDDGGRPHRPQLRLSRTEGHPARRRRGAAVAHRPVRRDRRRRRANAGDVPVTVKLRTGIDDDHLTYLEAGRIAQDLGVAAVALHARTAEQRYGPPADWSAIARLVEARRPAGAGQRRHLGGGRRAADGRTDRVRRRGRRTWLPRPTVAVPRPAGGVRRRPVPAAPNLGEIADLLVEHAELLVAYGEVRPRAARAAQAHRVVPAGLPGRRTLRRSLNQVERLEELHALLADVDRTVPFDEAMRRQPRGHTTPRSASRCPTGGSRATATARPLPTTPRAEVVSGG